MPILETKKLCRYFGGLKAVEQVDMRVEENETFGIIGPNGAGKTTFFNVCSGTYTATSGEVWFNGENITNKSAEHAAKVGLARTFQNLKLFTAMTVEENIAVGFHIRTKTNIANAILRDGQYRRDEKLIKEHTAMILEKLGLEAVAKERASNLSYGTQRKV